LAGDKFFDHGHRYIAVFVQVFDASFSNHVSDVNRNEIRRRCTSDGSDIVPNPSRLTYLNVAEPNAQQPKNLFLPISHHAKS
jgi:hypothetical protein